MSRKKLLDMTAEEVLAELELKAPMESRVRNIIKLHPHNRDVLKKLLSYNGAWLACFEFSYRNDEELVAIALNQCGLALRYANPRFLKDPKMVLIALNNNYNALAFVDSIFKNDILYVKVATDQNVTSVCHAGLIVRNNYQFMRDLLQRNGMVYAYLGPMLSVNYELANTAVVTYPSAICSIPPAWFTFELMFNTLTNETDRFFDLDKRIKHFGKLCTDNIYLMLEAARMYRKREFGDLFLLYTDDVLKTDHPILDWVRNTYFPDSSWPFIRQALLLNPEPFLNSQHILQQVMNGRNDWGVLAEYVLYEDALQSSDKHDLACKEPLTFDLI